MRSSNYRSPVIKVIQLKQRMQQQQLQQIVMLMTSAADTLARRLSPSSAFILPCQPIQARSIVTAILRPHFDQFSVT